MTNDRELFYRELNKLILDPKINRLSNFPQHNGSNTLAHCVQVAKRSFELAEILGWDIDEKELARGAMLHDYYQYNIKEEGFSAYRHGTSHPLTAMKKAQEDFDLTDKELNIIRGHMWPPNPKRRSWSASRTRVWRRRSLQGPRSEKCAKPPEKVPKRLGRSPVPASKRREG